MECTIIIIDFKNSQNDSKEIPMEGIQSVTLSDVQYFKKKGYHIKLVGTTQKDKDNRISSAILLV